MSDLETYLDEGVLGHHPVMPTVDGAIYRDLSEGALDYADAVVDDRRRTDRMFDALCDERSALFCWWGEAPFSRLIVRSRVSYRGADGLIHGGLVVERGEDTWGNPIARIAGTGGVVVVTEARWSEHGKLLVPIPVDLSTLGKHAPPTVHV